MNSTGISEAAGDISSLRVRYSISRWDLIRCRFYYVTHNRFLVCMMLACCVVLAVQSAFFGGMAARPLGFRIFCAVLVLIFALISMAVFQFLVMSLQVAVQKNRGVLGEHELEIRDDGLVERTAFNESLHRWPGFHKLVSTRNFLLIFATEGNVHYVPRKTFVSEQESRHFQEEIEKRSFAARQTPPPIR